MCGGNAEDAYSENNECGYVYVFHSFSETGQFSNAFFSILMADEGIVICFRLLQIKYLQPIITQYFIDNKSEIWLLFLIAHSKR